MGCTEKKYFFFFYSFKITSFFQFGAKDPKGVSVENSGKKLVTCKIQKKLLKSYFFSANRIFFKLEIVVAKKIMLLSPDRHKNSQWAKIRKKCNLLKSHI